MENKYIDNRFMLEPDNSLPPVVICDLDGTLAIHTSGRSPFNYKRVGEDTCDPRLQQLLDWMLSMGMDIIFLTGREESCRKETEEWIEKHLYHWRQQKLSGISKRYELIMRKTGDKRTPDQVMKKAVYENKIKGKFNVVCVFEDRNKVVQMWRDLGLLCCQVYEGDF